MLPQLNSALDAFQRKGFTASDVQLSAQDIQFTLTGEHRLPSMYLSQVMEANFAENIYAYTTSGNVTTLKIIL